MAKAAKVPHPLILYYFPTMDALFHETLLLVLDSLKEATLAAIEKYVYDPRKMMIAYIGAPFEWGMNNPGYLNLWIYFYHQTSWSEELMDLNTSIRKLGRDRITAMIFEGAAKKVFSLPNPQDVPTLAFQIQSLITGALFQAFTEKSSDPAKVRDDTVYSVMQLLKFKESPKRR